MVSPPTSPVAPPQPRPSSPVAPPTPTSPSPTRAPTPPTPTAATSSALDPATSAPSTAQGPSRSPPAAHASPDIGVTPASSGPPTPAIASTVTSRASPRIAARKRSAAELAEVRKQKRRLGKNKEAATAAAARSSALPLGTSRATPVSATTPPPVAPLASETAAVARATVAYKSARQAQAPLVPKASKKPRRSAAPGNPAGTDPAIPGQADIATASAPPAQERSAPTMAPADPPSTTAVGSTAPGQMRRRSPGRPAPGQASLTASSQPGGTDAVATSPLVPTAQAGPNAPPSPAPADLEQAPPPVHGSQAGPRDPFNLDDFLSRFHAGASVPVETSTPTAPGFPPIQAVADSRQTSSRQQPLSDAAVRALFDEFAQFVANRGLAATALEPSPPLSSDFSWTLPNNRGVLPPAAIRNLRASDYPPPANRVRGDFVPAPSHSLAAHRLYPFLSTPDGRLYTPMAFVLRMRLQDLPFSDAPPVLSATHSARFGRYGITVMHYMRGDRTAQLLPGSTDANYSLDFGANVLPPPPPACTTYYDLLGALQGLATFAHAEWYEPMTHVLHRLREFVVANMDADPSHSRLRVQRTLHEVNNFLGSAFVHLGSDSPSWWRDFCAAAHRIQFTSASWAIALHDTISVPVPAPAPASSRPPSTGGSPMSQASQSRRSTRDPGAGHSNTRPTNIPAHIRELIPARNSEGLEPCLRFFGGSMCPEGTTATCAHRGRTHTWPEPLPAALLTFIRRKFSRRGPDIRRRS